MKTLLVRFRAFLVGLAPFVLSFLVISNFIVSCSVYRSSHPQFVYSHSEVTNYLYSVVTNYSSVSLSSSPSEPVSFSSAPSRHLPKTFEYPYSYSVVSGKSVAFLFGRYFSEGDTTSHGVILRIFPERIFLLTGDIIMNSSFSDSLMLPNKERTKNDRRTFY